VCIEALCVITGIMPINIKITETDKYYEITKRKDHSTIEKWKLKTGPIRENMSTLLKDKRKEHTPYMHKQTVVRRTLE